MDFENSDSYDDDDYYQDDFHFDDDTDPDRRPEDALQSRNGSSCKVITKECLLAAQVREKICKE